MTVLLEKDGKRKEVEVLKRLERGREKVWLVEKKPQPQQEKGRKDDEQTREEDDATTQEEDDATVVEDNESTVEENDGMQQDTAEEIEAMNKMWLMEKVKELEKENGEMKAKNQANGGEDCPASGSNRRCCCDTCRDSKCHHGDRGACPTADRVQWKRENIRRRDCAGS